MNQSLNKSFSYFENRDKKLDTSNKDKHVKRDKQMKREMWQHDYNKKDIKEYMVNLRDKLEQHFNNAIDYAIGISVPWSNIPERDKTIKLNLNRALSC